MTFWRRFWLTITMKHSTIIHVNNYSLEATWLGGCLPRQEIDDSLSLSTSGTLLASWPRLDTSIANVPHFKRRSSEIESVLHLESLCRHLSSRRSSCQPEQPFFARAPRFKRWPSQDDLNARRVALQICLSWCFILGGRFRSEGDAASTPRRRLPYAHS